jgi:hypothetical protein
MNRFLALVSIFVVARAFSPIVLGNDGRLRPASSLRAPLFAQQTVTIDATLDDEKVTALFAWVSRAFAGEREYNNLMLAIASIFGDLGDSVSGQLAAKMVREARALLPNEEEPCGEAFTTDEREIASLGAMGAAQWTGQFKTRPHALLKVGNLTRVEDWVQTLPRGCKRTIKKALAQNFTVTTRPIVGGEPAPHSSLAHFRCVVSHEVRLLAYDVNGFFNALEEAISRYMGSTRMAGEIREYRDVNNKVIAIAHEVRKGSTVRGQWFYATDEAAQQYVWFHSVYELVRRAIETEGVTVVDLGPSGSDAFSDLKERYGFLSVDDWTSVANYDGPFFYEGGRKQDGTNMAALYEKQLRQEARFFH